jgi:hypothetical protein
VFRDSKIDIAVIVTKRIVKDNAVIKLGNYKNSYRIYCDSGDSCYSFETIDDLKTEKL